MVSLDIMLYCIYSNLIYAPVCTIQFNTSTSKTLLKASDGADYAKWTDVYITTRPEHACMFDSFVWRINATYTVNESANF